VKSGLTLTVNSADHYQWFDCDKQNIISGAHDQSYTVSQTGNYAAVITTNGCTDTSDCIFVETSSSILDGDQDNSVRIYPNPTTYNVAIEFQKPVYNAHIRLVNMIGQLMMEEKNASGEKFILEVISYASGIYFVEIRESGKLVRLMLVKQ
jgi:hypothetical protein